MHLSKNAAEHPNRNGGSQCNPLNEFIMHISMNVNDNDDDDDNDDNSMHFTLE